MTTLTMPRRPAAGLVSQGNLPPDLTKEGRVYAIAFDMDIESLRLTYGDPYNNADSEIRKILEQTRLQMAARERLFRRPGDQRRDLRARGDGPRQNAPVVRRVRPRHPHDAHRRTQRPDARRAGSQMTPSKPRMESDSTCLASLRFTESKSTCIFAIMPRRTFTRSTASMKRRWRFNREI